MNRERLDGWCQRGIIGLVLAILVYGPLATGAVRPQDFLVIQGLTVAVMALWAARFWLNPEHRLLWPPVCWGVVLFVAYAIVWYNQAELEYVARTELIRIIVYACLFFAIVNNFEEQKHSQLVAFTLIIVAVASSAYGIYQFTTKSNQAWHFIRPEQYLGRGSGTFIGPNAFAGFLELVLPVAAAYTIMGRVGHATRIALGYGTLVIMAGIGVSVSRGGIIASVIAMVVFFVVLVRKPGFRIPAVIVLAILLGAGVWFLSTAQFSQKRFESMLVNGKLEDFRFALWEPAIKMWKDHVWWGMGPAHFDPKFPPYRTDGLQIKPEFVHNDYLNTLVDYGVAGLAIIILTLLLLFWGVWRTWKFIQRSSKDGSLPQSNRTAFALGASVGLISLLLHSWVDFLMHVPAIAVIAITWMALLTGYWRFSTDRPRLPTGWLMAGLATLICAAGIAYLSQQGVRRYHEWSNLQYIEAGKIYLDRQVAALKKAHAIEPNNVETIYKLGEAFRLWSWDGGKQYVALAKEAMQWFDKGMKLDPGDPYLPMRYGMCLDWLDDPKEADKYFKKAGEIDGNNFQVLAHQGWHLVQKEQYAEAIPILERSLRLRDNLVAWTYVEIARERLKEQK